MTQNELNEILAAHIAWLEGKPEGRKAHLRGADLMGNDLMDADLRKADLRGANLLGTNLLGTDLRGADLRVAILRGANLMDADLQGADLRGASLMDARLMDADLRGTNLRCADLRGADLDFSCWSLWCGTLDVKVNHRIAAQLAYHFCRLDCDDPDYIAARNAILDFANTFHRAKECGKLIKK